MINQEEIKKILEIKGSVRGAVFQTDAQYVLEKQGNEGLKKLEDIVAQTGQPIKYNKEVRATSWYPLNWRILSLLCIKDAFNWDDEEIFKMGLSAPKYSFIVKTLLRYFVSLEKTFAESSKYWREHYTVGSLEAPEINIEGKRLVIRLNDFEAHPILCSYFKGYFRAIANLVVKTNKMTIREDKCTFRGDQSHEFTIEWE